MPQIRFDSFVRATDKQQLYIEQLAIDLNLTRDSRNAYICDLLSGRIITYLDELSKREASQVIEYFKELKEGL